MTKRIEKNIFVIRQSICDTQYKPAVNDVIWRLFFTSTVNIFWFDTCGGCGDLWTVIDTRGGNCGDGISASSCWPRSLSFCCLSTNDIFIDTLSRF